MVALLPRIRTAARWIADVSFPRDCVGCGAGLAPASEGEFCAACLAGLPWLKPPACAVCGEPFTVPSAADAERFESRTCVRCREKHPPFLTARAAFSYEGPIRNAVHAVKFRGRRGAAAPLGALLVRGLGMAGDLPADADLVVPVPLHNSRRRERGYNQAALIARPLAAALDRPLVEEAVLRERATPPQVGLDRALRAENLKGAFAVPQPQLVVGRVVVVVDDVLTTGATASAVSTALMRAGARFVRVAALARG